jgi:16S rRNA processing protein RimM
VQPAKSKGPTQSDPPIELGHVSGVFGFNGDVRLFLHHRESRTLYKRSPVTLIGPDGARVDVVLQARAGPGRRVLGRIVGVDTKEDALALKDWRIEVPRSALPKLAQGEFYWMEVVGLPVLVDGAKVGHVIRVHEGGPHEIFEVELDGGDVAFVPVLQSHVLAIRPPDAVDVVAGALAVMP